MDMNIVFPVVAITVFIGFFAWAKLGGHWPDAAPASTEKLPELASRRGWVIRERSSRRGYRQKVVEPPDADWSLVATYIPKPRSLGPRAYTVDVEWLDHGLCFAPGDVLIGPPQPKIALDMAEKINAFSHTMVGRLLSSHHTLPADLRQQAVPDGIALSVLANTQAFAELPLYELAEHIGRWKTGRPTSGDQVVLGLSPDGLAVRLWESRDDAAGVEALVDLGLAVRLVLIDKAPFLIAAADDRAQ